MDRKQSKTITRPIGERLMSANNLIQHFLEERYQQSLRGELKNNSTDRTGNVCLNEFIGVPMKVVAEPAVKAIAEPIFAFGKAALEKLFSTGIEAATKVAADVIVDPKIVHIPAEAPVVRVKSPEMQPSVQPAPQKVKPFATYNPFKLDIPTTYPLARVRPAEVKPAIPQEFVKPTTHEIVTTTPKEIVAPKTYEIVPVKPKEIVSPKTTEIADPVKPELETDPLKKPITKPDFETKTDLELRPELETKTDIETKTDTEVEPKTKTETKTKTKTEVELKTKTEPKVETEKPFKGEPGTPKPKLKLPPIFPGLGNSSPSAVDLFKSQGTATNIGLNLSREGIGQYASRQVMR
jgi:hypothetical protein